MKNILLLCTGNICRSPLAEALLARELTDHKVWSAGLAALVGQPADTLSVAVALVHNLDINAHRAQQVNSWMCQRAELILVMEPLHKNQLEHQFPLVRGKVFLLGQYSGLDVADPYKQPRVAFDAAFFAIEQGVSDWVPRIRQLR